ncbi:NAD(P)H-binding protein [Haloferax larsenii]|uniref:NAD(P)H-binding protein n=1 Tax=Haloferax larsenii TaxID=302484 RepID=A0ABY5RFX3_HALLR|nr:NAD(P)H-binding protein [Haloferax larsenii]ELZ80849.1 NmrA family protein [Haloferax larsenii JCM 13917]UVE51079.1 NAD(P)H-binding protein [Haloferax larsenii]
MRITVFGASGRTGVPFVRQAVARGHDVVAFVRSADRFPVTDESVTVVEGDAYEGTGVRDAVCDADAVVSVLGQTKSGPDDLLTVAGDTVVAAMRDEGVSRYVTLVGAGVRKDGESVSLSGKVMGTLLKVLAGEALDDATEHVRRVRASDLEWTVVRAPRLTDGDATGAYRHGDIDLGFESIDRGDVATFLLDCVEDDLYVHDLPKVGAA